MPQTRARVRATAPTNDAAAAEDADLPIEQQRALIMARNKALRTALGGVARGVPGVVAVRGVPGKWRYKGYYFPPMAPSDVSARFGYRFNVAPGPQPKGRGAAEDGPALRSPT